MIRANHALRLGLRAAARNPELAFGNALLVLGFRCLVLLPWLVVGSFAFAAVEGHGLAGALRLVEAGKQLAFAVAGASAAVGLASLVLGGAFWAGAIPLLAADAEMGVRPPDGLFLRLAARGWARVLGAWIAVAAAQTGFSLCCAGAALSAVVAFASAAGGAAHVSGSPGPAVVFAIFGSLALIGLLFLLGTGLFDVLGRLTLSAAAAMGDGLGAALLRATRVLGERFLTCIAILGGFFVLELAMGAVSALFLSMANAAPIPPSLQLASLAPRLAIGIVTVILLAWVEVARQGTYAILVADSEGLIPAPPAPVNQRPERVPTELHRPPPGARQTPPARPEEFVVEALPVSEPVVDALPLPDADKNEPEGHE